MKEKGNAGFKLNVGGPSIILLLCVLGLATFAVLTIRAAYSGLKMARTSRKAVEEYYAGDLEAYKVEYRIHSLLAGAKDGGLSSEQLQEKLGTVSNVDEVNDGSLSYSVAINDSSRIVVEMEYDGDSGWSEVTAHRLVVDDMEGYTGTGFEIEVIELELF